MKTARLRPQPVVRALLRFAVPRRAGLVQDRVDLQLLPARCKVENVNVVVQDLIVDETSLVRQRLNF